MLRAERERGGLDEAQFDAHRGAIRPYGVFSSRAKSALRMYKRLNK